MGPRNAIVVLVRKKEREARLITASTVAESHFHPVYFSIPVVTEDIFENVIATS
jgi:hypothetical protein